jgi:hypothetical protein
MQHARLAIIPESDLRLLVRRAGPPAASVCGRHLDTAVVSIPRFILMVVVVVTLFWDFSPFLPFDEIQFGKNRRGFYRLVTI